MLRQQWEQSFDLKFVITVQADVQLPNSVRASASTVLTIP